MLATTCDPSLLLAATTCPAQSVSRVREAVPVADVTPAAPVSRATLERFFQRMETFFKQVMASVFFFVFFFLSIYKYGWRRTQVTRNIVLE